MHNLTHHRMTPAFTSASLRPGAVRMGHFLNVDHFHMSQPTFPPHPHAGFSAITWMLPWSDGGFVNRDSNSDRSIIGPGALHWTLAGSGMLHEEIPEAPGRDCEGLQIFVKLPEELETMVPQAFHLDPRDIPVADMGGGQARVLVGTVGGKTSLIPSHAGTTMFHLSVDGEVRLAVPEGGEAFAVTLRGEATLGGATLSADAAAGLAAGQEHVVSGQGGEVLVAWSAPMEGTPTFSGPFCMFRRDRLITARARYASGEMGRLAPSQVRWVR